VIKFTFIAISFFVGWFIINHLRSYDVHEKEPFHKMALVTAIGGVVSIGLALLGYDLLEIFGIVEVETVTGAMLVVGPIEEAAKLAALAICYPMIKKDLNEPTDGLVYMGCVALGFSLIENYFYAVGSSEGFQVMALRVVLATPMHISFSLFMGLAFYGLLRLGSGWLLLGLAFGYAWLVHGLYDALLFAEVDMELWVVLFWALFLLLIRLSHHWSLVLLGYATAVSPHRVSLKEFIDGYHEPAHEEGLECLACGDTGDKTTYSRGEIVIQKCGGCEHFVTPLKSLFHIFHQFGANFRNLKYHFGAATDGPEGMSVLYRGNLACSDRELAYFRLDELNASLEDFTRDVVQKMFGFIRNAVRPPEMLSAGAPLVTETTPETGPGRSTLPELNLATLLYPFENPHKPKPVHTPPKEGSRWCWPAFFFTGFWFFRHELLSFGLVVMLLETMLIVPLVKTSGVSLYLVVASFIAIHVATSIWAPRIYYYRYGCWPGEKGRKQK